MGGLAVMGAEGSGRSSGNCCSPSSLINLEKTDAT